jgi:hypothetical protein
MRLTTSGLARNFSHEIVARLTTKELPREARGQYARLLLEGEYPSTDLTGYRAVLAHEDIVTDLPIIDRLRASDHFREGDVVVLEGRQGFVRSLYRPNEHHHSLFVTERCSSNCLMCSQPPKDKDDTEALAREITK